LSGWNRYKRALSDMLPCKKHERIVILEKLKAELGEVYKQLSYDSIVERLGTPQVVATSSIQAMEPEEIADAMLIRRQIVRIVALVAVALLSLWLITCTIALIDSFQQSGGRLSVSDPTIIDNWVVPDK